MSGGRRLLRRGEAWALVRFAVVGIAATVVYLGASLALLGAGVAPHAANLLAFALGTAASYLGHYLFTYRADASHLRLGGRFLLVTGGLAALCSAIHAALLAAGLDPRAAAWTVALVYPPASLALNHVWTFARGAVRSD